MAKAGCVALDIGMESGSDMILKSMGKSYSRRDIVKSVSLLHKYGILSHCNVIIGFPGETVSTVEETVETLNESHPNTYHCMQLYIAQKTLLSENKRKYHLVGSKLRWRHATMTSSEAENEIGKLVRKVTNSCLFIAGEYVAILLTAAGFARQDIAGFFKNIASGTVTDRDLHMMSTFFYHQKGRKNAVASERKKSNR